MIQSSLSHNGTNIDSCTAFTYLLGHEVVFGLSRLGECAKDRL